MALAQRNNRSWQQTALFIARTLGFDEEWMYQQLAQGRTEVMNMLHERANEIGATISEEASNAMQRGNQYVQGHIQNWQNDYEMWRNNPGSTVSQRQSGQLSQSNSQASAPMSKKRALSAEEGHGDVAEEGNTAPGIENQLDPIKHIWHRFPNSQTARLKWIYTQMLGGTTGNNIEYRPSGSAYDQQFKRDITTANTYAAAQPSLWGQQPPETDYLKKPMLIKYRMTCPYSIVSTDTGNLSQPMWLGYFDSMYQYYHVVKANWRITFTMTALGNSTSTSVTNPDYAFYVYWKYANYDDPPTQYTVENTGKTTFEGTTLNLTPDDYDRMGGWNKIKMVQNSTHMVSRVISGEYVIGDCAMDIKMMGIDNASGHGTPTATAEGWIVSGSTNTFPENLCVILVQDNAIAATTLNCNIGIRSEIDYTIQFKDLQAKYKYPTQSQAIGGDNDVGQYFFRGAQQLSGTAIAVGSAAVGTYN